MTDTPSIEELNGLSVPSAATLAECERSRSATIEEARKFDPGAHHYRAYVGSPKQYDVTGATQFSLMVALGLRERHTLLDIGCGSLCGGRLFIPYLLPDRYYGIEPQSWLIEDGIRYEVTVEMQRLKRPRFRIADDFPVTEFNALFDFMVAQSVLTHVSQTQLDRCLSQVKLGLSPEGLFAASFFYNGSETCGGHEWIYPDFASYAPKFVVDMASTHGLKAHPLIWNSNYGHYWMVFTHISNEEQVSWLADVNGEQRMLRILELKKALSDAAEKYARTKEQLVEAQAELSALKG